MATLEELKETLRSNIRLDTTSSKKTLSDSQYRAGFNVLVQGSTNYQSFIVPQLSQLLAPLLDSRVEISALEIGPGPKSVLGRLPYHQRRKIRKYTAFEPNSLFATELEAWLLPDDQAKSVLPCLETPVCIHRVPFAMHDNTGSVNDNHMHDGGKPYDLILLCHSMYAMRSKRSVVEQALEMLRKQGGEMVVVFHRDGALHLDGLVCHQSASFPTGVVRVADDDKVLDDFASFIAGFTMRDEEVRKSLHTEWRKACRTLGRHEEAHPKHLSFSSPDILVAFNRHATELSQLTAQVPAIQSDRSIKNREARLQRPASIYRPVDIQHIQLCVQWAIKHKVGLTVIAGGHSGHCVRNNVVSIDMSAFDQAYVLTTEEKPKTTELDCRALVVVEAGCTTGDVIGKAMAAGVTVPLGSRPSVGAGLWLQGGIGHLARLHGLACDAIIGAVVVSVESGEVLCVGYVPSQHRPAVSVCPENEDDMLWAMKGAGTNFGIVVSVTFKAYAAPTYVVRNWVVSLSGDLEAQAKLSRFCCGIRLLQYTLHMSLNTHGCNGSCLARFKSCIYRHLLARYQHSAVFHRPDSPMLLFTIAISIIQWQLPLQL
ncbi:FAD-binding domain-containing protein [Macroventuria anomochaeta]|uniref:FAD-binding domain-containing protein n=1 Tax=Macroventuria anomochaeta TaxID=301207 RepID=A0ACB6RJ55_9PLEO|nr:FAD-binding domain-containing protein [Macroventuria anomochaeta]KAF2621445.1 FAD-binding domain-containing protein [Macroventuria anomochaeta]